MAAVAVKDATYVLNHCTRSLARDNADSRHNYGQYGPADPRSDLAEAWRFPLVDSYRNPTDDSGQEYNLVTFVLANRGKALGDALFVIGSFDSLVEPAPLAQISDSDFWAASFTVPKDQVHYYRFLAGGRAMLDPINPQRMRLADGTEWSRFFTDYCTSLVVLERWEARLLERLTDHILPFRTTEGQRWLNYYYDSLDTGARTAQFAHAFRLDQSVGAASFIDKVLARQEQHRLVDYRTCLELCYFALRQANPGQDPLTLPSDAYAALYAQLRDDTRGAISGWDYDRYASPSFFLRLLRRHSFTGAFSHPKHGGNIGAAGWQFLAGNLDDPATGALPRRAAVEQAVPWFDWARGQEPPLGSNTEYKG